MQFYFTARKFGSPGFARTFFYAIVLQGTCLSWDMLPYCVYVLFSQKDRLLYIGFTTCLSKRLLNHQQGRTKSTASRRPLRLLHAEYFLSKKDVMRRERYLKTTQGKRMLKLMLRETLRELSYAKL